MNMKITAEIEFRPERILPSSFFMDRDGRLLAKRGEECNGEVRDVFYLYIVI
jgi:hypothetical protein